MHLFSRLILASAICFPMTAHAAAPPATLSSDHRLSDAEIEKVLGDAAAKREAAEEAAEEPDRRVHGEVGFTIGTGGYRSAFGTAVVPVTDKGVAILSFETTDFGKQRSHFGPYWR